MITKQIHEWIEYIQIPQASISNLPICPYAKSAIIGNKILIDKIQDISEASDKIKAIDVEKHWVAILHYANYAKHTIEELSNISKDLNAEFNKDDKVVLDNDPRTPFYIGEVRTSFEHGYLLLIQSLSDLTSKSNQLKNSTNYYSHWSREGLDEVVNWRQ